MQFPNHSLITYNIILEEEGEKRKKKKEIENQQIGVENVETIILN